MNFIKVKYDYLEPCIATLNDKKIKMNFIDRVIYGYIVGWIEKGKTFYMTDKQMSKILKVPISTISKHLRRLEAFNWIERQTSPISYGGKYRVDGSCEYSPYINFGCTYETALNYNNESNVDDGSCEYNFTDLNGDGNVNILDIVYIVNAILITP